MMERKFTDDEIVKAVECLHGRILRSRFSEEVTEAEIMGIVNALDLINRQKAEIERLKEAYAIYEETTGLRWARAEAIKEFVDRLKEEIRDALFAYEADLQCKYIDNLVKEMTGENNGN